MSFSEPAGDSRGERWCVTREGLVFAHNRKESNISRRKSRKTGEEYLEKGVKAQML